MYAQGLTYRLLVCVIPSSRLRSPGLSDVPIASGTAARARLNSMMNKLISLSSGIKCTKPKRFDHQNPAADNEEEEA
jgi:hypothetical protein